MIRCKYVGSMSCDIGDREFDAVGQEAEFSEQGFKEAVLGGAVFIPNEYFDLCNFLPEHVQQYGPSGVRIDPPQVFMNSLAVAQDTYKAFRQRMLNGEVILGSDQCGPTLGYSNPS